MWFGRLGQLPRSKMHKQLDGQALAGSHQSSRPRVHFCINVSRATVGVTGSQVLMVSFTLLDMESAVFVCPGVSAVESL